MSIKLDLTKFKHLKSDDKHATLQHKDGHVLTIAIAALKPDHAKAIKAMACGGDVLESEENKGGISTQGKDVRHANKNKHDEEEHRQSMDFAKKEAKGRAEMERHNKPNLKGLAEGGYPSEGLDLGDQPAGGKTFAADHGLPCLNPNCKSHGRPHPNCRCYDGAHWHKMAEGGKVPEGINKHYCHSGYPHSEDCKYYADGGDINIDPTTGEADMSRRAVKSRSTAEAAQKGAQGESPSFSEAMTNISNELFGKAEGGEIKENTLNYQELIKRKKEMNNAEAAKSKLPPRKKYAEGEDVQADNKVPFFLRANSEVPESQDKELPQEQPQSQPEQPQQQDQDRAPHDEAPISAAMPKVEKESSNPLDRAAAEEKQLQAEKAQSGDQVYTDELTKLTDENKAFQHDLANGHISPKTYSQWFEDKSLPGKLGTLFGMLVSGVGSGLTHQGNAVIDMMNKEIDRDYQAQVKSKDNAQNFYKLAQEHALAMGQAKNLEQSAKEKAIINGATMHNIAALDSLAKNVATMPEGPRKQIARAQLAGLYDKLDPKLFNLNSIAAAGVAKNQMLGILPTNANNARVAPQQGAGNEAAFQNKQKARLMFGPEGEKLAQFDIERHFPGLPGAATTPLDSHDRESITSGIEFDKKLHRFMSWASQHSGDLNPADMKYGKALAAELQGAYRMATHGGVYKEGEQNFISKIIDEDPTKFFNKIRVMPQLQALSSEHQARMDNLVKTKGFPGYPGAAPVPKGYERQWINNKPYLVPIKGQ